MKYSWVYLPGGDVLHARHVKKAKKTTCGRSLLPGGSSGLLLSLPETENVDLPFCRICRAALYRAAFGRWYFAQPWRITRDLALDWGDYVRLSDGSGAVVGEYLSDSAGPRSGRLHDAAAKSSA
jgi:hypothetical protein